MAYKGAMTNAGGKMTKLIELTEVVLFDWGNTLMVDFPDAQGKMCDWETVQEVSGARALLAELSKIIKSTLPPMLVTPVKTTSFVPLSVLACLNISWVTFVRRALAFLSSSRGSILPLFLSSVFHHKTSPW